MPAYVFGFLVFKSVVFKYVLYLDSTRSTLQVTINSSLRSRPKWKKTECIKFFKYFLCRSN